MFDKDSLKDRAILSFAEIKKKDVEKEKNANKKEKSTSEKRNLSEREMMKLKIETAKLNARREMELFEKATWEYIEKIKDLVAFSGVPGIVEDIMIHEILKKIISPLIEGKFIHGIPEDYYRNMRANMYNSLIEKYVNDEK